jgi:hypothetical protein
MERALSAAAAVLTWVGWLTICPALAFPTLGTAAMINRALFGDVPEAGHEPGFWLGWIILIAGLVGAVALFLILERLRLLRASIRTGLIYGAALWLLSGGGGGAFAQMGQTVAIGNQGGGTLKVLEFTVAGGRGS